VPLLGWRVAFLRLPRLATWSVFIRDGVCEVWSCHRISGGWWSRPSCFDGNIVREQLWDQQWRSSSAPTSLPDLPRPPYGTLMARCFCRLRLGPVGIGKVQAARYRLHCSCSGTQQPLGKAEAKTRPAVGDICDLDVLSKR